MDSKLNDAAKNVELGVTGVSVEVVKENGKEIVKKPNFPPTTTKKYPISISERALREYIARGGEILVIPVEGKEKQKEIASLDSK